MHHSINNSAVEVCELTKQFGRFTAVDHISFAVPRGQIFGFLGPNGAGKTTTIRMLLGLLKPSSGQATVLGLDVVHQENTLRRHIGYMSQRFSLYNDLSVVENLNFYAGAYGVRGERLKQRKQAILQMAGLIGHERELVKHLAGGWKQRLALGAAIIHEPQMLFLDEPTAGVDPVSRRIFWNLLYDLAGAGTTILVTTHYMDEAEQCEQLAFIQAGRLVAEGSPHEIKAHTMHGEVLEIACDRPDLAIAPLRRLGIFEEVALYGALIHVVAEQASAHRALVQHTLDGAGVHVTAVDRIAPSLEDVFIASARQAEKTKSQQQ